MNGKQEEKFMDFLRALAIIVVAMVVVIGAAEVTLQLLSSPSSDSFMEYLLKWEK